MNSLECLGCFTVFVVLKCDFILWSCCHSLSLKENICGLEASFWLLLTDEMPSDAEVKVRICNEIRDWKVSLPEHCQWCPYYLFSLSVLQTWGTCGTFSCSSKLDTLFIGHRVSMTILTKGLFGPIASAEDMVLKWIEGLTQPFYFLEPFPTLTLEDMNSGGTEWGTAQTVSSSSKRGDHDWQFAQGALFSKTLLLRMAFQNVFWFRQPLNLDLIDTTVLPWFLLWMFKDLKAHFQWARLPVGSTGKRQDTHPMTQLGMGLLALQPTSEFGKVGILGSFRHEPPMSRACKIPMWNTGFGLETVQLTQGEQRKRESCQVLTLMQNFKIPSTVLDQALTKQVVREQVDRWEYEIKTDSWKKQKHLGVLRERLTHFDKNCWNFWIGHSQNIRIWKMWKTQNGVVHGIFQRCSLCPWQGGTHSVSPRYSNLSSRSFSIDQSAHGRE